jgi:hypothetical protein
VWTSGDGVGIRLLAERVNELRKGVLGMFCTECGKENPASAKFCASCGQRMVHSGGEAAATPIASSIAQRSASTGTRSTSSAQRVASMERRPINGKVTMRNPQTGELKQIKDGFSWTTCIFWDWLGIPLFNRGLTGYAWFGVAFGLVSVFLTAGVGLVLGSLMFGIWLGSMANAEHEKVLLSRGWGYES